MEQAVEQRSDGFIAYQASSMEMGDWYVCAGWWFIKDFYGNVHWFAERNKAIENLIKTKGGKKGESEIHHLSTMPRKDSGHGETPPVVSGAENETRQGLLIRPEDVEQGGTQAHLDIPRPSDGTEQGPDIGPFS